MRNVQVTRRERITVPGKKKDTAGQAGEAGRFQLYQGSYDHFNLDDNEGMERQSLFRIDTVTGQVWELQSFSHSGNLITEWKLPGDE